MNHILVTVLHIMNNVQLDVLWQFNFFGEEGFRKYLNALSDLYRQGWNFEKHVLLCHSAMKGWLFS